MAVNNYFSRRFVIFFQGRSGSTYLVEALDSHPQIRCEIERLVGLRQCGAQSQLDWVRGFLNGNEVGESEAIGFKTKLDDVIDNESLAELLRSLDAKVILLYRTNVVKTVISWFNSERLYAASGDWNLYPPSEPLNPIEIDLEKFDRRLGLVLQGRDKLQAYVHSLKLPTLQIFYEEILLNEQQVLRRLCELLQVPYMPLHGRCMKATDDDLRQAIKNFNQIYVRYQGTHYQQMLDEVLGAPGPVIS